MVDTMPILGQTPVGSTPTNHRHKVWKMWETNSGWGYDFALSCVDAFYMSDQWEVLTQEIIFGHAIQ